MDSVANVCIESPTLVNMVQISSEAMNSWDTSPPPGPGLPGLVLPSSSSEQLSGLSGSSSSANASFSALVLSSPLTRLNVTPATSMPIFSSSPQVMHLFSWASPGCTLPLALTLRRLKSPTPPGRVTVAAVRVASNRGSRL